MFQLEPKLSGQSTFLCEISDFNRVTDEKRRSYMYVQACKVQYCLKIDIGKYIPGDSTTLELLIAKVFTDSVQPVDNIEFAPSVCDCPGTHVLRFSKELLFYRQNLPQGAEDFQLDLYNIQLDWMQLI